MQFPEGLENTPLNWKEIFGFRNIQEKLENYFSSLITGGPTTIIVFHDFGA